MVLPVLFNQKLCRSVIASFFHLFAFVCFFTTSAVSKLLSIRSVLGQGLPQLFSVVSGPQCFCMLYDVICVFKLAFSCSLFLCMPMLFFVLLMSTAQV